jgi:hypothetical protein
MQFGYIRGAMAAVALTFACGSAHAFTLQGNYNVTFNVAGGGQIQYCVNLTTQGAQAPYRDLGTSTFYSNGSPVASGTYVVYRSVIAVAVTNGSGEYLTASGDFNLNQGAFNTAVIDLEQNATIVGTATFTTVRNGGKCSG